MRSCVMQATRIGLEPKKDLGIRGHSRVWTEEEDAHVLKLYPIMDATEVGKPINRSRYGVICRFNLLMRGQARYGAPWTAEEDNYLRSAWPDASARTLIAKLKPRTWNAIYYRAEVLGLRHLRLQGHVSLRAAAEHVGWTSAGLLTIIKTLHVAYKKRGKQRFAIELEDVEVAVKEWDRWETLHQACQRLHVDHKKMAELLKAAGKHPGHKRFSRYPPELTTELVAAYRKTLPPNRLRY